MMERSLLYIHAFDYAVEQLAGLSPISGRLFTIDDALAAVKATHYHCGPIARIAEAWIGSNANVKTEFHSLNGHYVLRDVQTGRLFDAEAVGGREHLTQLPIYARTKQLASLLKLGIEPSESAPELFQSYAKSLMNARGRVSAEGTHSPGRSHPCAGARSPF